MFFPNSLIQLFTHIQSLLEICLFIFHSRFRYTTIQWLNCYIVLYNVCYNKHSQNNPKAHHDISLTIRLQVYPILDKYFRQKWQKCNTHINHGSFSLIPCVIDIKLWVKTRINKKKSHDSHICLERPYWKNPLSKKRPCRYKTNLYITWII